MRKHKLGCGTNGSLDSINVKRLLRNRTSQMVESILVKTPLKSKIEDDF